MIHSTSSFYEIGKSIAVEGNKPVFLKDEDTVWIVSHGQIEIFIAEADCDEVRGHRRHLFTAQEGDILFGIDPSNGEKYSLLAVGMQGAQMIVMERQCFFEKMDQACKSELVQKINHWIEMLYQTVAKDKPPKELLLLYDETEIEVGKDKVLYSRNNVLWLNIEEDFQFSIGKVNCLKNKNYIPLVSPGWIKAERKGTILPLTTENYINCDPVMQSLVPFQQTILQQIIQIQKEMYYLETKRFHTKMDGEQALFQNALMDLGAITDGKQGRIIKTIGAGNSLLQACCLLCEAMQIDINPVLFYKKEAAYCNDLADVAQALRIRYRKVALREEWWKKDNGPLLGYMEEDDRAVALIPLSPGKYQLHDPSHGTKVVVGQEVAKSLKPFANFFYRPFPIKKSSVWGALIDSFKSLWKADVLIVFSMGIAGGILSIILPLATGFIFDEIIPQGERIQLVYIALFLAAGVISKLLFQFVQLLAMGRIEGKIDSNIQASIWDRLLDLPINFFKKFSAGELAMKAINIGIIRQVLSGVTINSIFSAVFSIPSVLLLFYYNRQLAFNTLLLAFLAMGMTVLFSRLQIGYNCQVTEMENRLSGLIFQIIRGISKFKVSGAEKRGFFLWAREFGKLRRVAYKSEILSNLFLVFTDVFPLAASLIIFYWVGKAQDEISLGIFIAFNAAFNNILYSILSLAGALMRINNIIPIFESAAPILETLPEYDQSKRNPGELSGDVEVSHVSFRYESGTPFILEDISLHIHSGEYVAIVGTSGGGKSTLLRILLGFEKPEVGKVYYDGQDLAELDIRRVRKQLGVVMQNSSLIAGDIYTNIVGSSSHLTIDDAWEAAGMAGIEEDIRKMPMGMQTILSEGGSTLSGGQRQRLFIARAIANKPRIIYFDEATSALDNQVQAVVSQSLEKLNVTRVVIAHRLSTIINCDRIIVLDKGKIVEQGSYEELMDKKGIFTEIANRQLA